MDHTTIIQKVFLVFVIGASSLVATLTWRLAWDHIAHEAFRWNHVLADFFITFLTLCVALRKKLSSADG